MASKYDGYWTGQLAAIRAGVARAADGRAVVIGLPELTRRGERQSWYGFAEVHGRDVVCSSMAHATSLGRVIAASGVCVSWPAVTFRFAVSATGDRLTISVAGGRCAQAESPVAGRVPASAPSAPAAGGPPGRLTAGEARSRSDHVGGAAAERFYLGLRRLAEIVGRAAASGRQSRERRVAQARRVLLLRAR